MSDNADPPMGPCRGCGAVDAWDCLCEDAPDNSCICCQAPTDGSDYCDTCMYGDCPDCI